MTPISKLREYLEMVNRYGPNSVEAVVLKHGREYTPPVNPRPMFILKGPAKECYRNAYRVAEKHGWAYVEGFAVHIGIPLQHAWVVKPSGQVIETTWLTSGVAYIGIPLDMKFINSVLLETQVYGVLNFSSPTFRAKFL